jgi:hypothetical protein
MMRKFLESIFARYLEARYGKPPAMAAREGYETYRDTVERFMKMDPEQAEVEIANLTEELRRNHEAAYYAAQLGIETRRRKINGDA